ncbi:helix-turn-helix domain-containing protein [Streptococcus parasuis]
MADFKDRLKELRKERGFTQKKLGELCGINEANIRKYELGKQNPKIETIDKIASALGVSTLEFIEIENITGEVKPYKVDLSLIPIDDLLSEINRRCGELTERIKTK